MTMQLRITNLGPAEYTADVSQGPRTVAVIGPGETKNVYLHKNGGELNIVEIDTPDPAAGMAALAELADAEPILKYFTFSQLPVPLQVVSRPFCVLAVEIVTSLPKSAERTVALRKLLEGKDAAVRAAIG